MRALANLPRGSSCGSIVSLWEVFANDRGMTMAQASGFSLTLLLVLMLVVIAGCGDTGSSISKSGIAGVEWQWSELKETQPTGRWCPIRKTARWSSSQMA